MSIPRTLAVSLFFLAITLSSNFSGTAHGGLIAKYNFDNSTANDSIGTVNGTLLGGASFESGSGLNGSVALRLNQSTSGLVDMGNNFSFSNFSIQAWVEIRNGDMSTAVPFGKHIAGAGIGYYVSISESTYGTAHFYPGNYPFTPYSSQALNDGTWHQIVATLDSSSGIASLYIDGDLSTSTTGASTAFSSTPFLLGGTTNGPTYTGLIDDVLIYDSVLTANEVKSLYLSTKNGGGTPPVATPEPGTMLLLGFGAVSVAFLNRRRHKAGV